MQQLEDFLAVIQAHHANQTLEYQAELAEYIAHTYELAVEAGETFNQAYINKYAGIIFSGKPGVSDRRLHQLGQQFSDSILTFNLFTNQYGQMFQRNSFREEQSIVQLLRARASRMCKLDRECAEKQNSFKEDMDQRAA
jgi:hypothetical protein